MARFLSPEWFDQVAPGPGEPASPATSDRLVLRQVVRDTPDGEVSYHVVLEAGVAQVFPPGCDPGPADLTITTGWETAVAMARGELATQAALIEGKLRIRGNLARVAGHAGALAGLDPLPASVRQQTTY